MWLKVPGEQYKKIKSRGNSEFNNLNEFIIERILFFGNTTKRVKQSKVNELYTDKLNSSIKIYTWKMKQPKSVGLNAKNLPDHTKELKSPLKGTNVWKEWNGKNCRVATARGLPFKVAKS